MNYPLLDLTNYLLNVKYKLSKGIVVDKMQEELSSIMESRCTLRLSYMTGESYPCSLLRETSYHYIITGEYDRWTIQFTLSVLKDAECELNTKLLFNEIRHSGEESRRKFEKDHYLR